MNARAKVLIPDREWLVKDDHRKIGSILKGKKGYVFTQNGRSIDAKSLAEIKTKFGIAIFEESINRIKQEDDHNYKIYGFDCKTKPYNHVYSVKKKLPLYAKCIKSKSQYCAGHYIIKFQKGWVKSFCPKLITLERYPYQGPWKTEEESKIALKKVNQSCE